MARFGVVINAVVLCDAMWRGVVYRGLVWGGYTWFAISTTTINNGSPTAVVRTRSEGPICLFICVARAKFKNSNRAFSSWFRAPARRSKFDREKDRWSSATTHAKDSRAERGETWLRQRLKRKPANWTKSEAVSQPDFKAPRVKYVALAGNSRSDRGSKTSKQPTSAPLKKVSMLPTAPPTTLLNRTAFQMRKNEYRGNKNKKYSRKFPGHLGTGLVTHEGLLGPNQNTFSSSENHNFHWLVSSVFGQSRLSRPTAFSLLCARGRTEEAYETLGSDLQDTVVFWGARFKF